MGIEDLACQSNAFLSCPVVATALISAHVERNNDNDLDALENPATKLAPVASEQARRAKKGIDNFVGKK